MTSETKTTHQTYGHHHQQQQQQLQGATVSSGKDSDGGLTNNNNSVDDNLPCDGTIGLPRKFVDALRSLFSLLDESKLGFIKLSDLESRWITIENESNVPKGLIECLHSFQTAHDCIDFDRFCHALAVCISRDSSGNEPTPSSPTTSGSSNSSQAIPSTSTLATTTTSISITGNNELKGAAVNPGRSNFPETHTSSINSNHDILSSRYGLQSFSYGERITSNSEIINNACDGPVNLTPQEIDQPFSGDDMLLENVLPPTTLQLSSPSAFTASIPLGVSTFNPSNVEKKSSFPTTAKTTSCENICTEETSSNRPGELRSDYQVLSMPQLRETRPSLISNDQPVTSSDSNLPISSAAFRQYSSETKIGYDSKNQRVPMRNRIINILKEWKNNAIHRSKNPPLSPSVALGPGTSIAPTLASNITSTLDKSAPSTSAVSKINGATGLHATQPKMLQDDDDWGFSSSFGLPSKNSARTRHGKRREARRHTITTGIDINTVKRLQQFEQEKEILLQGLEMIERGREWYSKSINNIQNKIRFIGQTTINPGDYSLDANQERINFQAVRILTVNQHLAALMDNSSRFPVHMNLALRPLLTASNTSSNLIRPPYHDTRPLESAVNVTVQRLKEQNRLLTEEVSMKSDKITILEREKSALIRELFQTRSNSVQKSNEDIEDNTFM